MRLMRPLAALLAAGAMAAFPLTAAAHAELTASSPAAGATVTTPPSEVVLTFSGELSPESSGFTVTDPNGDEVGTGSLDLDVPERNQLSGAVTVGEAGTYTVEWTAVAADAHPESGTFSFTYAGQGSGAGQPDTAVPGEPVHRGLLLLMGLAVLATAGFAVVRRRA